MKNQQRHQRLLEKRVCESEVAEEEATTTSERKIDLDQLFEEEHRLSAWVEARDQLDEPLFNH